MKTNALLMLLLMLAAPLGAAADEVYAPASPNKPWPLSFGSSAEPEASWGRRLLLWLPNRVLDLIDVFRVDAGVGPAYGGVLRLTRWGQAGYRQMAPGSVRIGDFGRKAPVLLERKSEWGVSPVYHSSSQRRVCDWELGAGLDLLIVGGYAGLCLDAVPDLVGGLAGWDPESDDLR